MHLLDLGENIVAGLVIRRHPVPPGLDVPVGRINGLIIQQGTCEDRQVGTTMLPLPWAFANLALTRKSS